jgi:hypothetical protein
MANFQGRLVAHQGDTDSLDATFQIEEDWIRVFAGHRRFGAWERKDIKAERVSVFRFHVTLADRTYTFTPDDPGGFSDAIGAVVDARSESRFGLKERIEAVRGKHVSSG